MVKKIEQNDFKELFEKVKAHYPDLKDIDDTLIDKINNCVYRDRKDSHTISYIYSTIGATLTFFIYPFLAFWLYNSINTITNYFIGVTNIRIFENKQVLNISLIIGTFALLSYIFLLPIRSGRFFKILGNIFNINLKHNKYALYSVISSYFIFGSILLILFINFPSFSNSINILLKYYLFLPIAIILLILLMITIVMVVILPFNRFIDDYKHSRNKNIEIIYEILILLSKYDEHNQINLIEHKTYILMLNKLQHIAFLIKKLSSDYTNGLLNDYSLNNYNQVALDFQDNTKEMIVPNNQSIEIIKLSLIKYLKCFMTGNLKDLPRKEIVENIESKKPKETSFILGFIFLLIYLLIPIGAFLIFENYFKVELNELTQSLLKIAYIIWALFGVISNNSILNEDSKNFVKDIIQTILGKK